MNDNHVYSLYVTDYTHNDAVSPVHASWCVPALADFVFKIELWKEAAGKGPTIQSGEFYTLKNVRIKESSGGYWEGSFSEVDKLKKLDVEEIDEAPHLRELLVCVRRFIDNELYSLSLLQSQESLARQG